MGRALGQTARSVGRGLEPLFEFVDAMFAGVPLRDLLLGWFWWSACHFFPFELRKFEEGRFLALRREDLERTGCAVDRDFDDPDASWALCRYRPQDILIT